MGYADVPLSYDIRVRICLGPNGNKLLFGIVLWLLMLKIWTC